MIRSGKRKVYTLPVDYDKLNRKERFTVREQYVKEQNNKCYWCKHSLTTEPPKEITDKTINWKMFPEGFLDYPIHLQHDHYSGMTEGAVHGYCNAVMWQYHNK